MLYKKIRVLHRFVIETLSLMLLGKYIVIMAKHWVQVPCEYPVMVFFINDERTVLVVIVVD